jgi:hypothetical protein
LNSGPLPWATPPALFLWRVFQDRVSWNYLPGLVSTRISHWCLVRSISLDTGQPHPGLVGLLRIWHVSMDVSLPQPKRSRLVNTPGRAQPWPWNMKHIAYSFSSLPRRGVGNTWTQHCAFCEPARPQLHLNFSILPEIKRH